MSNTQTARIVDAPTILGTSRWSNQIRNQISQCAGYDSTVLVTGPTGTGKEVIARAIHAQSQRCHGRLIPVDCTSISGSLFASQLFGHRKGAFTGADYDALGCFRAAHKGTIFLDEIGELGLNFQASLLRVLQERCVIPLGSSENVPVDVRVIAATNRDLKKEVSAGRFREDLYFRLNVMGIETVPLRDRVEDVPLLAEHFLEKLVELGGFPRKRLSPGAMELLATFSWPGNVRQLRHVLEKALITSEDDIVTLPVMQSLLDNARLPQTDNLAYGLSLNEVDSSTSASPTKPAPAQPMRPAEPVNVPSRAERYATWPTLEKLERDHIYQTLELTCYNQTAAARLLGVTRNALIRKLKRHQIEMPSDFRRRRPR